MSDGIGVNPEAYGLVRPVQERAPKAQDLPFGVVEIVDEDVEVHLLGRFTRGPVGSSKPIRALQRKRRVATVYRESHPFRAVLDPLRAQQRLVEPCKSTRFRAVDDNPGEPSDHARNSRLEMTLSGAGALIGTTAHIAA